MNTCVACVTAATALTLWAFSTYGETRYWDNNGNAAGFGLASGTWGVDSNWNSDPSGSSEPSGIHTTVGDDLYFGTRSDGLGAGTIMVEGTNQAFRSITIGAASGSLTLSGGMLTLAEPRSSLTVNNLSNTISTVLAGPNGLHKVGRLYYPEFLTTNFVTLFPNSILADCFSIRAKMEGGFIPAGIPLPTPFFFTNTGTTLTAQLQGVDGEFIKCVKIELTQSGQDILGRAVYAKYMNHVPIGFDFDTGGNETGVATNSTALGYGICNLHLVVTRLLALNGTNTYSGSTTIDSGILAIGGSGQLGCGIYTGAITNDGQLLYASSADQRLTGSSTGIGSLLLNTPEKIRSEILYTNFLLKTTPIIVFSNAWVSDCVAITGSLGGSSISGLIAPGTPCFFTNAGSYATVQMQAVNGGHTKCVKIELTQSGTHVAARAVYAKYLSNGTTTGFDFDTGGTEVLVATSFGSSAYGAVDTTFHLLRSARLTLSATNSYTGGTILLGNVLEATSTDSALPPVGGIAVHNGGELLLNVDGMASGNATGVGPNNPIVVNSGGKLMLAGKFNAGYSRPITLDGGTMTILAYDSNGDGGNYFSNLTLKNGARVTGNQVRVGALGAVSPVLTVSGTLPSLIEAGINMVQVAGTSCKLIFNVEDVTGSPETDLSVPGKIRDFSTSHLNFPMLKTGAGTLTFSGAGNTHVGPITIQAGTLALRADTTLNPDNAITLNGGALDMGAVSNRVGALTVSTNSVIVLGAGILAFADSRAAPWTGPLALTGTLGPRTLRFGTNETALTSQQLSAMTLEGGHLRLKKDGYVALGLQGTLLRLL